MAEMLQTGELATENLWLLAYMLHMAQTAQPAAAKHLYGLYVQQETRQLEANERINETTITRCEAPPARQARSA